MTDASAPDTGMEALKPHRSLWYDVWAQFRTHRGALVGVTVFTLIVLAVVVGPYLHTVDPTYLDYRAKNLGPSWAHPFGTDNLGRDMLAQVMAGGRVSLAVGFTAMALSLLFGVVIGVLAGFFRWLDGPLMRLTDLFLALPLLPLLLVIIMLFRDTLRIAFGPEAGIFLLIVFVIGITSWMQTARIVRGDVLALKEREFVMAARSIGTSRSRYPTSSCYGSRAQYTILFSGNSTMPLAPASCSSGRSSRTVDSSMMVLMATILPSASGETVGEASAGKRSSTFCRRVLGTLSIRPTLPSAAMAPFRSRTMRSSLRRFQGSR